jgi:uncharacterized protein
MNPLVEQVYSNIEQRFTGIDDMAHGWEHVKRVYNLALMLADREGADPTIVALAALLHDLGRTVSPQETAHHMHHADLSVALASELLTSYHVSHEEQQPILHAILSHSFTRGVEPQTLEARIVRDADRLDGLGAIGILRWAVTGVTRKTFETSFYHPSDPFGQSHTLDDTRYMLDHFYSKLLKLSTTMLTETGRELAKQRTDFMLGYLEQLRRELALLEASPA